MLFYHKNKFRAIDFFRIMVCEFSADMYANPTVLQPVARMPRGGLIGVKKSGEIISGRIRR